MNLNEEQLKEAELHAQNYLTCSEIGLIIGLSEREAINLFKDKESDFYKRINKGRLLMLSKIRKQIFTLAEEGSSSAQPLAMKIIEETTSKDKEL